MVGLLIVSHSAKICEGIVDILEQMVDKKVNYRCVGGGEGDELGVNVNKVISSIYDLASEDGIIVIVDFGSTVIGVKAALESLGNEELKKKIYLSNAPIVEGAFVAAVEISLNKKMEDVIKAVNGANNMPKFNR